MCDKENRMNDVKEMEATIARLMLEINRLHGELEKAHAELNKLKG
jgi:uncharacterized small protein (DUF1192 family)